MSALSACVPVRRVVTIRGRDFDVLWHAVERYHERVAMSRSCPNAERELLRKLRRAEITLTMPGWARGMITSERHPDEWLGLPEEGLLFPVERGRVLTCLAREHVGAQVRIVR